MIELHDKYSSKGLTILALTSSNVDSFVKEHKINYPVLFGGREKRAHVLSTIEGIERFSGYPTTIFIGRDGKVKNVKVNFVAETPEMTKWQVKQFDDIIAKLLKE